MGVRQVSFTLKDAPQDFLDGLERDRELSRREAEPILARLAELNAAMDEIGRPSQEESVAMLTEEIRRRERVLDK